MVVADSYYRIGKAHQTCQDYADHYRDGDVGVAHLSDGCSTAESRDVVGSGSRRVYTDFGARLLVIAAQRQVGEIVRGTSVGVDFDRVVRGAVAHANDIHVGSDAVSATLIGVEYGRDDSEFRVQVSGDGWLAARRVGGLWDVFNIEYPSGAPYYLRYCMGDSMYYRFLEEFGRSYKISMWSSWTPGSLFASPTIGLMELPECGGPFVEVGVHVDEFIFPTEEFDLVLAFSDGLGTFYRSVVTDTGKALVEVPASVPLSVIIGSVRGLGGDFIKRSMGGPFGASRKFAADGLDHQDDLSIIGVGCG